jgi:hypothetical protein
LLQLQGNRDGVTIRLPGVYFRKPLPSMLVREVQRSILDTDATSRIVPPYGWGGQSPSSGFIALARSHVTRGVDPHPALRVSSLHMSGQGNMGLSSTAAQRRLRVPQESYLHQGSPIMECFDNNCLVRPMTWRATPPSYPMHTTNGPVHSINEQQGIAYRPLAFQLLCMCDATTRGGSGVPSQGAQSDSDFPLLLFNLKGLSA